MKQSFRSIFFHFIRPRLGYLCACFLFSAIGTVLSLFIPVLTGRAIDYLIGVSNVDFGTIGKILIVVIASILISTIFQWLMSLFANKLSLKTVMDIRNTLFQKLNRVPLKYIDSNKHGDLLSRMITDTDQISDGLLQGFMQLFSGLMTIVGTLIFMLILNYKIALAVVVITPLSLVVSYIIARRTHRLFVEQSRIRGEMSAHIEEMVSNQKVVRAFGYEEKSQKEFERINAELYQVGVRAQFASSWTNPSTRLINWIVYTVVGVIGVLGILWGGGMSVGQISSFLSYANQYTKPFNEISGVVTELQAAFASMVRVMAVVSEPDETPDDGLDEIHECDGRVGLDHVCFSYTDQPFIEGLDISVQNGSHIAIVGPTGCGKTTLINLLMRFYDVTGGEIRVSGKEIRTVTRKSLRDCYGMVLQDSWLFTGTIRENLMYGNPTATEEEMIAAAKKAHAHPFIMRMPNGYDTYIETDGGNISQGQKQLLCIARVMLTNPKMLILDEATSSIDTLTEIRIQKAFDALMAGRTSFIVAHRLSTIRDADLILVMKDGKIIEKGNHAQLLSKNGFYAKLYQSQFVKT